MIKGKVIFLIGFASCGKTTTAETVKKYYEWKNVVLIDNDEVRKHLNSDVGFLAEGRQENIRRVTEIACLLANQGFNVICSFTMPTKALRGKAKSIMAERGVEGVIVKLDTQWEECANRKWKPFFYRDQDGKVKDSTGTTDMFEDGEIDMVLDSSKIETLFENCNKIAHLLN